eukprot:TRINITY_DN70563_c0_g1_i1.p1 TRINITY_DN70563_c0_g1~~TRINITY_DN70563_c0_g1_i1.p1  ORF type:complete len:622 (+),score=116.33 TRINITY_DN70563_c0_g1_i1:90-1955(+)
MGTGDMAEAKVELDNQTEGIQDDSSEIHGKMATSTPAAASAAFAATPSPRPNSASSAETRPKFVLEAITDGLADAESARTKDFAALWDRLSVLKPDAKVAGTLLATAGAFLFGPVRVSSAAVGARLTDVNAVRATSGSGVTAVVAAVATTKSCQDGASGEVLGPCDVIGASAWDDAASDARQREVSTAVRSSAVWAKAEATQAARACVRCWVTALWETLNCDESRALPGDDDGVSAALAELLPAAAAVLRADASEVCRGDLAKRSVVAHGALLVSLSFHWLFENAHYKAMRDRLGLCLPPVLQTLDTCTDAVVQLVGMDALQLLLDRAMAAEVQHFVPPLEHTLASTSPLFLDNSELTQSTVAPYCAANVLLLLKGYTPGSASRLDVAGKFLAFGAVHCRGHTRAFRVFLEFGLIPLLRRDVFLVATRVKQVVEMLLQATESMNAAEALLAWEALCILFSGVLQSRARYYAMDILLRVALSFLTFVVSNPPPELRLECGAHGAGDNEKNTNGVRAACKGADGKRGEHGSSGGVFVSPVVEAMTASEWALVEHHRAGIQRALGRAVALLVGSGITVPLVLEKVLKELESCLPDRSVTSSPPLVEGLKSCTAFIRAAASAAVA